MFEEIKAAKHCPYCGSNDLVKLFSTEFEKQYIHCRICGTDGPKKDNFSWGDRIDAADLEATRITKFLTQDIKSTISTFQWQLGYVEKTYQEHLERIHRSLYDLHLKLEKNSKKYRLSLLIKGIKRLLNIT